MLVVIASDGQRFQLPYYHFLGGQYRPKSDTKSESYMLQFALHIVGIVGVNLLPIVSTIDEMRVKLVRPADIDKQQPEVRITRIDVASRHEDE